MKKCRWKNSLLFFFNVDIVHFKKTGRYLHGSRLSGRGPGLVFRDFMERNCTNDFVLVVSFPERIRNVERFLHVFLSVREGRMHVS